MTIKEKLKAEEGNYSSIVMYGDRSDWIHVYERSAYAFTKLIRKYKVAVQIPKNGGMSYCHIGFPKTALDTILRQFNSTKDCPDEKTTVWVIRIDSDTFTEQEFQTWKRVETIEQARQQGSKEPAKGSEAPDPAPRQQNGGTEEPSPEETESPVAASLPEEAEKAMEIIDEIRALDLSQLSPWMALNYLVETKKRISGWKQTT